jgi:hypothetical protein
VGDLTKLEVESCDSEKDFEVISETLNIDITVNIELNPVEQKKSGSEEVPSSVNSGIECCQMVISFMKKYEHLKKVVLLLKKLLFLHDLNVPYTGKHHKSISNPFKRRD